MGALARSRSGRRCHAGCDPGCALSRCHRTSWQQLQAAVALWIVRLGQTGRARPETQQAVQPDSCPVAALQVPQGQQGSVLIACAPDRQAALFQAGCNASSDRLQPPWVAQPGTRPGSARRMLSWPTLGLPSWWRWDAGCLTVACLQALPLYQPRLVADAAGQAVPCARPASAALRARESALPSVPTSLHHPAHAQIVSSSQGPCRPGAPGHQ